MTQSARTRARPGLLALISVALMLVTATAHGSIIGFKGLTIDFTDSTDATSKAEWSEPQKFGITEGGLGWDGEAASSREGWIRTKPLAVGHSWRPVATVSMRVSLSPAPREIGLAGGQKYTPPPASVFVRYSPDLQQWSSWQALQAADPTEVDKQQGPSRHYQLILSVAREDRSEYNKLLSDYARLNVPWKSDEEAAVRWIVQRDPAFFGRQIPFIGYIQFLVETHFYGGQRIRTFSANVNHAIGGRHYRPEVGHDRRGGEGPWRYVAPEKQETADQAPGR